MHKELSSLIVALFKVLVTDKEEGGDEMAKCNQDSK